MCSIGLQLVYCDLHGNQLNGSLPGAWGSTAQVSKAEISIDTQGKGAVKHVVKVSPCWSLSIASSHFKRCCFYIGAEVGWCCQRSWLLKKHDGLLVDMCLRRMLVLPDDRVPPNNPQSQPQFMT